MQDIKLGNKVLKNVAAIKVPLVEGEGVYMSTPPIPQLPLQTS